MTSGVVEASVRFATVTPSTVCELVVGRDAAGGMLCAGLGGDWGMYSIRQWTPGSAQNAGGSWTARQIAGDRINLKADTDYHLLARVSGSVVTLEVNGVMVLQATQQEAQNQARQVGLFCMGESDVVISKFRVQTRRSQAFIVMQFSEPYDDVYAHVIKDVCAKYDIEPVRADEMYGPGIIVQDVIAKLASAHLVIADISPANPNVYFEVGYALALGKPIILLAQRPGAGERLPFDLSPFRVLFYDDSIGGKQRLEAGISEHMKEILRKA